MNRLLGAATAQRPAPTGPAALAATCDVVTTMQADRDVVLQSMAAPSAGPVAQTALR